jgi:hypothetical protein
MAQQALAELNAAARQQRGLGEELHYAALARGELDADLNRRRSELRADLATLAGQQLPALRDAVVAAKVVAARSPLEEALRVAQAATAAAAATDAPLKTMPAGLQDQAKALDPALQDLAEAAVAIETLAVAQSRPALDRAQAASAAATAAQEKARSLSVACGEAEEAARLAAEQARNSGDPADQKAADKAARAADEARAAAEAAQRQVAAATQAAQEARQQMSAARKTLDNLLAHIGAVQTTVRTLSQQSLGLAAQIRRATAGNTAPDLAAVLRQAAVEQQAVAARVESAAILIARAAEHQQRLGDLAAAKALRPLVARTAQLAGGQMAATAGKLATWSTAAAAESAAGDVEKSVRAATDALEAVLFPNAATASAGRPPTPADDADNATPREIEVARQLVHAIDLSAKASGSARQAVAEARRAVAAQPGQSQPPVPPPGDQSSAQSAIDPVLHRGQNGQINAAGLTEKKAVPSGSKTLGGAAPDAEPRPAEAQNNVPSAARDAKSSGSPEANADANQNQANTGVRNQANPPQPTVASMRSNSPAPPNAASLSNGPSQASPNQDQNQEPTGDGNQADSPQPAVAATRSNSPALADAARLFDVAARMQSRRMVQDRSDVPQEKPQQQTKNDAAQAKAPLQTLQRPADSGDLKPLRSRRAKDLAEGEQEETPEADRTAIEAYFRAVAKETAAIQGGDASPGVPAPAGPRPRKARSQNR